jgi:hypothetical protein
VPDREPAFVGDGEAELAAGVPRPGGGEATDEAGVERPEAVRLARPLGQASQGEQREDQVLAGGQAGAALAPAPRTGTRTAPVPPTGAAAASTGPGPGPGIPGGPAGQPCQCSRRDREGGPDGQPGPAACPVAR